MITMKSKFSEAYEVCKRLGACEENLLWGQALMKKYPDLLVSESLKILKEDTKAPQLWSVWIVAKGKGEIDTEVQNGFMEKITDPMTALQLLLQADYLTEKQDKYLEKIYKGKLPTAEKELRKGVITTAKSRLK
jgi:hypothetical protein